MLVKILEKRIMGLEELQTSPNTTIFFLTVYTKNKRMHKIYNKSLKNTAQLVRKTIKPLNLIITLFASKIDEMRSNAFSLMRLHWNVFTFAQKPLNKPVFSITKIAMAETMLHYKLSVKVEQRCISVWKEQWAKRLARVTLLADFGDQFVIVMDTSNGFWFLPGGGVEQNESIKEAAKREALEELGLEIKVNQVVKEFRVTLISKKTKEQFVIPSFIIVYATPVKGKLKVEYAPNRKIILVKKKNCRKLLHSFKIPIEYERMSPYYYVSKEVVRQLAICST